MERKKAKHAIAFPLSLDMGRFVKGSKPENGNDRHQYHLRGVLLHKGTSAYHGHYEAQIFDVQYVFSRAYSMSCTQLCFWLEIKRGISLTMK